MEFQELLEEFKAKCDENGFILEPQIILKPELVDGVTQREKNLVGSIVNIYCTITMGRKKEEAKSEDLKSAE
jgi:hypothetical protein